MAEMTAEKAVEWLTSDKAFGQECYSRKQIAALVEQQAAICEQAVIITKCRNGEINDGRIYTKALDKIEELVKSNG